MLTTNPNYNIKPNLDYYEKFNLSKITINNDNEFKENVLEAKDSTGTASVHESDTPVKDGNHWKY